MAIPARVGTVRTEEDEGGGFRVPTKTGVSSAMMSGWGPASSYAPPLGSNLRPSWARQGSQQLGIPEPWAESAMAMTPYAQAFQTLQGARTEAAKNPPYTWGYDVTNPNDAVLAKNAETQYNAFQDKRKQELANQELGRQKEFLTAQQSVDRERLANEAQLAREQLGWAREEQKNALQAALDQIAAKRAAEEALFGTKMGGWEKMAGSQWERLAPLIKGMGFNAGTQPGEVTGFSPMPTGQIGLPPGAEDLLRSAQQEEVRKIRTSTPGRRREQTRLLTGSQNAYQQGLASLLGKQMETATGAYTAQRGQSLGFLGDMLKAMRPEMSISM